MLKQLASLGFAFLFFSALTAPAALSDTCVSGTITAELETEGDYAGLYKYTVNVSWEAEQDLSNLTLDLGFGQCPEFACASTWIFPNPAGNGTVQGNGQGLKLRDESQLGQEAELGDCNVRFKGEFNCKGNPSIGFTEPVLKWDLVGGGRGPCGGASSGTAELCFYSDVPPSTGNFATAYNKNGQNVCDGRLSGVVPVICAVNTENAAWGTLKLRFGSGM